MVRGRIQRSVPSVACFIAWYRFTSLQLSPKQSCSLHVFGHNLRADCLCRTLVPLLDNGADAALVSVQALSAVQALMLEAAGKKMLDIMNNNKLLTLSYCYSGGYLTRG